MTQNKIKTCGWPGCEKEVFAEKALLCGQHDREGREHLETAGKVVLGVVAVVSTLSRMRNRGK